MSEQLELMPERRPVAPNEKARTIAEVEGRAFRAMHSWCGLMVYLPSPPASGVKNWGIGTCPWAECERPDADWWRQ